MAQDLAVTMPPRILIVSRRTVRKNKFVDFVGEYHLDLIISNGAAPIIIPRVNGIHKLLESFEPIHGVLLCEGEDINPSHYEADLSDFSHEELEEIKKSHASDTAIDHEKDLIELKLAKICLERNIPYLGICRGSQILNVASGGTLYQDIDTQISKKNGENNKVVHMDYENYDGHRHDIKLVENTPIHAWFRDSLRNGEMEIFVNSYHHQGVRRLAQRFVPMAFAPDGLIEGFYDADNYNPEQGKFIVGLQFHPERMQNQESGDFDYPGCAVVYQEFVKAVIAYEKSLSFSRNVVKGLKFDGEILEKKRKCMVRSFSVAENMYIARREIRVLAEESEFETEVAEFHEANKAFSLQRENRLRKTGATVMYMNKLKMNDEKEKAEKAIIGKMSLEKLSEMVSLYNKMEQICSEVLEMKVKGFVN